MGRQFEAWAPGEGLTAGCSKAQVEPLLSAARCGQPQEAAAALAGRAAELHSGQCAQQEFLFRAAEPRAEGL